MLSTRPSVSRASAAPGTPPARPPRARWKRAAIVVLGCAALGFAGLLVARDAERVRAFAWHLRPARLAAATLLEVGLLAWSVVLWSRVLACFGGPRPRLLALMGVWFRTNLAKYLPGSVWPLVAAGAMAEAAGGSAVTLSASFVLHAAFNVVGALAVAALAAGRGAAGGLAAWGIPAALAASLALVHPAAIRAMARVAGRLTRRRIPEWRGGWLAGCGLLGLYALTWVGYGLAFALFVSSVAPARSGWWELAGSNALAFVAGFVAVFAPAGIGVREAALAALLAPALPDAGVRTLVAVASRIWLVGTELAGGVPLVALTTFLARRPAAARGMDGTVPAPAHAPHAGPASARTRWKHARPRGAASPPSGPPHPPSAHQAAAGTPVRRPHP